MNHSNLSYILSIIILALFYTNCKKTTSPYLPSHEAIWEKTYGGEISNWGFDVQETSNGGYIIVGKTSSFSSGDYDVYIIKTNSNGDTIWTKTIGGEFEDSARSVRVLSDGGFIIVGQTKSFGAGNSDAYVIRIDMNGDTLWTKTYGGNLSDNGKSIIEVSNGGYLIIGDTNSFVTNFLSDIYLIKIDEDGNTLWEKTYGGDDWDVGWSIQETSDNKLIMVGSTQSFGSGDEDVYFAKLTQDGDTICTKTFGGASSDWGYSVQEVSDGGYIIVGGTSSFGEGSLDVYIIRTDANGDLVWSESFGGVGEDEAYCVRETDDGKYMVAGRTESYGKGYNDFYILEIDNNGNGIWESTYGGTGTDRCYSFVVTSDDRFILVGETDSFGNGICSVYLIKIK